MEHTDMNMNWLLLAKQTPMNIDYGVPGKPKSGTMMSLADLSTIYKTMWKPFNGVFLAWPGHTPTYTSMGTLSDSGFRVTFWFDGILPQLTSVFIYRAMVFFLQLNTDVKCWELQKHKMCIWLTDQPMKSIHESIQELVQLLQEIDIPFYRYINGTLTLVGVCHFHHAHIRITHWSKLSGEITKKRCQRSPLFKMTMFHGQSGQNNIHGKWTCAQQNGEICSIGDIWDAFGVEYMFEYSKGFFISHEGIIPSYEVLTKQNITSGAIITFKQRGIIVDLDERIHSVMAALFVTQCPPEIVCVELGNLMIKLWFNTLDIHFIRYYESIVRRALAGIPIMVHRPFKKQLVVSSFSANIDHFDTYITWWTYYGEKAETVELLTKAPIAVPSEHVTAPKKLK